MAVQCFDVNVSIEDEYDGREEEDLVMLAVSQQLVMTIPDEYDPDAHRVEVVTWEMQQVPDQPGDVFNVPDATTFTYRIGFAESDQTPFLEVTWGDIETGFETLSRSPSLHWEKTYTLRGSEFTTSVTCKPRHT